MQSQYPLEPQPPVYPPAGYLSQPGYSHHSNGGHQFHYSGAHFQGTRLNASQVPMYPRRTLPVKNNFAVTAFIQGIVGTVGAITIPVLGFILGVMACIFGGLGMSRANKVGVGQGMAITAIVLGPVAIIVSILASIVWASLGS